MYLDVPLSLTIILWHYTCTCRYWPTNCGVGCVVESRGRGARRRLLLPQLCFKIKYFNHWSKLHKNHILRQSCTACYYIVIANMKNSYLTSSRKPGSPSLCTIWKSEDCTCKSRARGRVSLEAREYLQLNRSNYFSIDYIWHDYEGDEAAGFVGRPVVTFSC